MSKEKLDTPLISCLHFNTRFDKWGQVAQDIVEIERECFGDNGWSPETLEKEFMKAENIAVYVLEEMQNIIVGYTIAEPRDKKTAYVSSTAIRPEWQKRGYLGLMMGRLERELKYRGFNYMERDASIDNGYADSIEKHYGDRVVDKNDHDSDFGRQRFFRIDIRPYWERQK